MRRTKRPKLRVLLVTTGRSQEWKDTARYLKYRPARPDDWHDGDVEVVNRNTHSSDHVDIDIEERRHHHPEGRE